MACGHQLDKALRDCPECGTDNDRPNVRRANREDEVAALGQRVKLAWEDAIARGADGRLRAFQACVERSHAVAARWWSDLDRLINQGLPILNYYQLRGAGLRNSSDDYYGETREANDSLVNPEYFRNLHMAVLSIDGRGARHYGNYHLTWHDEIIANRTSVFEENPYRFNKRLPPEELELRLGHRATWGRRSDLAVAKLAGRIDSATTDAEFAAILCEPADAEMTDFIEVHIDEPAPKAAALQHVVVLPTIEPIDEMLWQRMQDKLRALNVTWEEVPA